MPGEQNALYRFAEFEVNPVARTLTRKGDILSLSRRSFDLLLYFVKNPGKILSKDELLSNIWSDAFVDENSLAKSISVLRKALDEPSTERSFVLTLPGRGYQFAVSVEVVPLHEALLAQDVGLSRTEAAQAFAELGTEAQSIGVLRQQRTIRTSTVEVQRNRTRVSVRGWFALAFVTAIAAVAIGGGGYLLWRHFHPAPQSVSVVLADFENTTGEKDFDFALNRAFQIELEQSPFLDILPGASVRQTLAEMQRKADDPLTPDIAREVCERNNAQVVLTGSISSFAGRYLLTMDASSCVTGKTVAGYQQTVAQKADVLPALDTVAGHVRKQLGESAASLGKFQTPIAQATTGSLEALRAFTQAVDASDRGDGTMAQTLFQRAIALDSNFASAYKGLSVNFYNRNNHPQALLNIQKAYSLRAHTTERERLTIEIAYNAFGTYDYQASIAALRLFNQLYPNNATNWGNLSNMYTQVGDYAQAITAGETAWRIGPRNGVRAEILARAYKRAGRFADAKRVAALIIAEGKDTFGVHSILFQIAIAEHDAERIKLEGEWGFTHDELNRALDDLGQAAAAQGKLREATADLSRARQEALREGDQDSADSFSSDLADLLADAGDPEEANAAIKDMRGDGGDAGGFALLKSELGDMTAAKKFVLTASSREETNTVYRYSYLPMVRALMAIEGHQPAQAVEELEPARPYQMSDFSILSLRARAESEAGMPDRAADDYRLILANEGIDPISPLYNVAHLRLARVLAEQKKFEPARAEYEAFLDAWKDGDPQSALILAAKTEYSKLPPG